MTRGGLLPLHAFLSQFQVEEAKECFWIGFCRRFRLASVVMHYRKNCK